MTHAEHASAEQAQVGIAGSALAEITVVVPAYGPGPYLQRVIGALRQQDPPVGPIIVSHSGDGDPSARFAGVEGVTVLHAPERLYAGAARNRGLALVTTEWVAFVDEDVIVDDGWHAALQAAIARNEADCIAGSIGHAEPGGYWGMTVWHVEFGSVHPYLAPRPAFAGASANLAVRASNIRSIGGFPEDWRRAQDTLAQVRLNASNARIAFEPRMIARHINLPGFQRMLRHLHLTGRYSARLRKLHSDVPGSLAARIPAFSLGLWIARLFQTLRRALSAQGGPRLSLLYYMPGILVGLLAWNIGFSREAFRRRPVEASEID